MTVFLVYEYIYREPPLLRVVCSTREQAAKFIKENPTKQFGKYPSWRDSWYDIDEWEVL